MTDEKKNKHLSLKRVGIGCGGAFLAFIILGIIVTHGGSQKTAEPPQPSGPNPRQVFQDAVLKRFDVGFGKRSKKGVNLIADLKTFEDKDITLTVTFDRVQPLSEVIIDTEDMTRAILSELQFEGRKPSEEGIRIMVFGETPAKGETGTARVIRYGEAYYEPSEDAVKFKQPSF
jgi:hypothetical protein